MVFFDFNQDLMNQLGRKDDENSRVINQAALRLHEALYMLSVEYGQKDSVNARLVVGLLLSNKMDELIERSPKEFRPTAFRSLLSMSGFDLVATLYGTNRPAPEHGPYSVETRRNSYMKLRDAVRASTEDWLKSQGLTAEQFAKLAELSPNRYLQGLYEEGRYFAEKQVPLLSDEAVFLYVSESLFGSEGFESLLTDHDGRSPVRSFCEKIRTTKFKLGVSGLFGSASRDKARDAMLDKVLNYCDGKQNVSTQ
jgi:hypothetical protein